jgi:hypothetical protein
MCAKVQNAFKYMPSWGSKSSFPLAKHPPSESRYHHHSTTTTTTTTTLLTVQW